MKGPFKFLFLCCFIISCNRSSDRVQSDVKIELFEALSNPEAFELIKEIESDYVFRTLDTALKNINVLDNAKYHPLTSRLLIYNKMGEYRGDSAMMREGPCGFCAIGSCGMEELYGFKLADSILRSSEKLSSKYDLLWSDIVELCGEVRFLSVLARNNFKVMASDIKEMVVEDYSSKKLMSYPIHDYVGRQDGKKVLAIKWNDRTKQKIDSVYGTKKSVVCMVTINDHTYMAGELDTLNSGVTLRDVNLTEGLLDSLAVYFSGN